MAHVTTLLKVDQGTTFTQIWEWGSSPSENSETFTPYDLTGYTAKCQIRSDPRLTGSLYGDNIPITLGTTNGRITLTIPGATSAAWKWEFGFYDVVLTHPDTTTERFAQGQVVLNPAVTIVP